MTDHISTPSQAQAVLSIVYATSGWWPEAPENVSLSSIVAYLEEKFRFRTSSTFRPFSSKQVLISKLEARLGPS